MTHKEILKELHRQIIKHQPTHIELVSHYSITTPYTLNGIKYYVPKLPSYDRLLWLDEDVPIEHVDVSGLNWSGMDNISNMFRDLKHLKAVNFGGNIKQTSTLHAYNTFAGCISLNVVNLSSFYCGKIYVGNMLPHSAPERVVLPMCEQISHEEFLSPNVKECVFSPKTQIARPLLHWFYDIPRVCYMDSYLETSFYMTEEQYLSMPSEYYDNLTDDISIVIS